MEKTLRLLTLKRAKLDKLKPMPPEVLTNLEDWFQIELTYTSNAIEGNTLSRAETALVVEKGLTVDGKTLKEHLEATNHAQAWEFVKSLAKRHQDITQNDILEIHHFILQRIDDANAGRYRTVAVRVAGSQLAFPNSAKVPDLMNEFISWLTAARVTHPSTLAADAHFKLVTVHPFVDGNGRTARLLMNLILLREGYPPAIIKNESRRKYIAAIEKARATGQFDDYYSIIYKAVEHSLDIYLKTIEQKETPDTVTSQKLLKIGELAGETKEAIHTLRYWTNQGLLEVAAHSPGGYQLYHPSMVDRVRKIRELQSTKRLTIAEIGEEIKRMQAAA